MEAAQTTGIGLEFEFSYRAELKAPIAIGPGPYGTRMFFEIVGGTVEGERISGAIGTGGGEWALVDAQGILHIDVRGQILTGDGAAIYMSYGGALHMNEKVQQVIGGAGDGDWDNTYFRTAPRLETGDERYAWINGTVFVAEGRVMAGPAVEYRVFRVT